MSRATLTAVLLWLAVALTAGIAIAVFPGAWDDSGGFAFVLVGVPAAAAALAVVAQVRGTARRVLTGVAAAVMLLWSLVTALGLGLFFLVPALLLIAAAAATPQAEARR